MLKIGQVGSQKYSDGAEAPLRLGQQGDQIVSELHGRYYEQAIRGNLYVSVAPSALSLPAGSSSTAPVWTLYNPAGSGFNLALVELLVAFASAPAAATVLHLVSNVSNLLQAPPSSVTVNPTRSAVLGAGVKSAALCYSAATLATNPSIVRNIASIVAASSITPPFIKDEIAGAVVIPPGGAVSLAASAAASVFAGWTWEEIPI